LLLTTTALTAPGYAQTATPPAAAPAPAMATPTDGHSGGFGSTQPTDIGTVRTTGQKVTPDGVTGQDIGGGLMIQEDQPKTRSTVTRDYIAKQSPTANPYQLIDALPGVNSVSSDAYGLNGGNITIRGFNSNEIGLTIDGAPINDSGNYALYPQEYLDAPNIGQISVAQGYTDLDSPHVGATGGVINIYSRDPSKDYGGFISLSTGTNYLQNEFIRLETGEIGRVRAYVSYSNYSVNHWRGYGQDQRNHIDAKVVADVGDASKITISAIYNEEDNNSYYTLTKTQYSNGGAQAASNNYDGSFNAAGTATKEAQINGYYKDYINPFKNLILTAPSSFALTDDLTYEVTPYYWYGIGDGGGATALSNTGFYLGGNKIIQNVSGNSQTNQLYYSPSITETFRPGIINKFNYQLDNHHLVAGVWYEAAEQHQYGTYQPLNPNGTPLNVYGTGDPLIVASGPFAGQKLQKRNQITNTRVTTLFAGDTANFLNDRITVDFGIKQAFVGRNGNNMLTNSAAAPIQQYSHFNDSQTLPTAAISYKLNAENQLFAGISTTFKTPANYGLYSTVSPTSGAYVPAIPEKDETAVHAEIGHRFQGELVTSSVSVFGYQFSNRQLATYIPDPASPGTFVNGTINVGSTTSYGIDAEVGTRPINHFRPYVSLELSHDTLDGNLVNNGSLNGHTVATLLNTKGKFVPAAPSVLAFAGVDYDDGSLFGTFGVKFAGRQFGSFNNDEAIPAYARINASIGYRFEDYGRIKAPTLRLNLYNIANQTNLTGVSTISTNVNKTTGLNGAVISGSNAYYYVGQGFAAIATLSSAF